MLDIPAPNVEDASNEYDVWLMDDGTLDTVVQVSHPRWNKPREYRFDDSSDYRDEDGCLNLDAFIEEVIIPEAESEE